MSEGDVGSPDYDAVSAVLHEVYDTSITAPFCMLNADVTPVTTCGTSTSGAQFTAQVFSDAHPADATHPFATNPELYTTANGVWDNLVLPYKTCTPSLSVQSDGTASGGDLVQVQGADGSLTTLNDSTQAISPLMSTSIYTPWKNGGPATSGGTQFPWVLQPFDKTPSTPPFAKGDSTGDGACMGWALEASRYDLYNGKWAYDASATPAQIEYFAVEQGVNGADGALLWSDLSTGLQAYVASKMTDTTRAGISSPAAAAGQVWMLSNQAGPWVNSLSVRAAVRGTDATIEPADLLTFTCPDSGLSVEPMPEGSWSGWPGWNGMQGQAWGAFHKQPNVVGAWALDQAPLGPCDPATLAVPPYIATTGSTENNFGVFYDFNIQVAAWLAMALQLQGIGPTCPPTGISTRAAVKYTPATTGVPQIGCYELAFMPLSWFGPPVIPPKNE